MGLTPAAVRSETTRRVRLHATRTGETVRRLRLDAGLTRSALGRHANVDPSYLARIEAGTVVAPIATLTAIGVALGCDSSFRYFEGAGPRLHDRFQAPMVETFLGAVATDRWHAEVEVTTTGPSRGVIDVVLDDRQTSVTIATEMQSGIHRLEQQIRWMHAKAEGLALQRLAEGPGRDVSSLLVLRSTVDTRAIAARYATTLATAFPARVTDMLAALTTSSGRWPGPGLLWMRVERGIATLLDAPPRGVTLGR
jgi:transcriptional regulator with XRE-family HTH domain